MNSEKYIEFDNNFGIMNSKKVKLSENVSFGSYELCSNFAKILVLLDIKTFQGQKRETLDNLCEGPQTPLHTLIINVFICNLHMAFISCLI